MMQRHTDNLTVIHYLKDSAGHGLDESLLSELSRHGLLVDTCLRQVWLIPSQSISNLPDVDADIYHGQAAYSFLLQTITGLNSSIPGETNVQGQFRCSWKRWQSSAPAQQLWPLNQLMQQLLADARQIRTRYLQNIGGQSYGSLARKLLQPDDAARVLFIGSGKFSLSVLPFFKGRQTAIWNRRLHKGLQLPAGLTVYSPDDQSAAAAWATDIVLTTPADNTHDQRWLDLALEHNIRKVLHLGRRRADAGIWQQTPAELSWQSLDDVFDLRRRQSSLRDLNVMRARLAAERIAKSIEPAHRIQAALPQRA